MGAREQRRLKKRYSSYDYTSQQGPSSAKLVPAEYYLGSPDMNNGKPKDADYFPLMAVTPGSRTSEQFSGSTASRWPSQHVTPRVSAYSLQDPYGMSPRIVSSPPPTGRVISYASVMSDSRPGSTLVGSEVGMAPRAETPAAGMMAGGDTDRLRPRTESAPPRVSFESPGNPPKAVVSP